METGMIGKIVWALLFLLAAVGVVAGCASIVSTSRIKTNKYPLALKLLFCVAISTLLSGAYGTLAGYLDSFAKLASPTGANKASVLKLLIRMVNVNIEFAVIAVFVQMIFIVVSLCIIEKRASRLEISGLSLLDRLKTIPVAAYFAVAALIPTAAGSCVAFWGIEKIVLLKSEESMPLVCGIDFGLFLKIGLAGAVVGLIALFVLLIQTLLRKYSHKT
jgi:hypothetical protein